MTPNSVGNISEEEADGDSGIKPAQLLAVAKRRALLILMCTLAAGLAALVFSLLQEPKYEASSSLLFREPKFGLKVVRNLQTTAPSATDYARTAATNVELANQSAIADATAETMGDGFEPDQVESEVEVENDGESDLIIVTATDPDPETAQRLANTYAEQVVAYRAATDRDQILSAKKRVDRIIGEADESADDLAQYERASRQLGILALVQTGNVEFVQSATLPTSVASPKTGRNTVFGLIIGLIIGLIAAFVAERFDRRLRSPNDVEDAFGLPVLGVIPEDAEMAASNRGEAGMHLPFAAAESFRMVRASLRYFNVDSDIKVVMITSEIPEEGKSTVAWNLANVAALSGNALLIETDLRRPSLSRQHGVAPAPGLAEYLTHQVGLEEIIQHKSVLGGSGNGTATTLDVISAGTPPPNPSELLESHSMEAFLNEVRAKYDLVVIDTAPVGVVSDSLALAHSSDGAVVVSRINKSTRESATRLKERLQRSGVTLLGVIANGVKSGRLGGYGGYGGYGYQLDIDYSTKPPQPEVTASVSVADKE